MDNGVDLAKQPVTAAWRGPLCHRKENPRA